HGRRRSKAVPTPPGGRYGGASRNPGTGVDRSFIAAGVESPAPRPPRHLLARIERFAARTHRPHLRTRTGIPAAVPGTPRRSAPDPGRGEGRDEACLSHAWSSSAEVTSE